MEGDEHLEKNTFERALKAAVTTGNHVDVAKLVVKGATDIDEALKLAVQLKNYRTTALLLLVFAALNGNCQLVVELFAESFMAVPLPEGVALSVEDMKEVQKAVISGQVSTSIPIEIAQRKGKDNVREELLLHTKVNQDERTVNWHGLQLLSIELSWIRKIQWVRRLDLGHNGFWSIPSNVGQYFRHVSTNLKVYCSLMSQTFWHFFSN